MSAALATRSTRRLVDFPPAYFATALVAMLALHFSMPVVQWNLGMARWLGLPFVLLGAALVAWSVRRFVGATTIHPREISSELVTNGAYRFTRNPMYLGLLLSLVGAAVMLGSLTPVLVAPPFFVVIRQRFVLREEEALERRFGEEFRRYRKRVRRWV